MNVEQAFGGTALHIITDKKPNLTEIQVVISGQPLFCICPVG